MKSLLRWAVHCTRLIVCYLSDTTSEMGAGNFVYCLFCCNSASKLVSAVVNGNLCAVRALLSLQHGNHWKSFWLTREFRRSGIDVGPFLGSNHDCLPYRRSYGYDDPFLFVGGYGCFGQPPRF